MKKKKKKSEFLLFLFRPEEKQLFQNQKKEKLTGVILRVPASHGIAQSLGEQLLLEVVAPALVVERREEEPVELEEVAVALLGAAAAIQPAVPPPTIRTDWIGAALMAASSRAR